MSTDEGGDDAAAAVTASSATFVSVVIVGGGVTGLTLACILAQNGVNFILVDAVPTDDDSACGSGSIGGITALDLHTNTHSSSNHFEDCFTTNSSYRHVFLDPMSVEVLSDLKISPPIILAGHAIRGNKWYEDCKATIETKFNGLPSHPIGISISRRELRQLLTDRLESLGYIPKKKHQVYKLEVDDAVVTGPTTPEGGSPVVPTISVYIQSQTDLTAKSVLRCQFLIGCDGPNSIIRQWSKTPFDPVSKPIEFLITNVMASWGFPILSDKISISVTSKGPILVVPTKHSATAICIRRAPEIEDAVAFLQPPENSEIKEIIQALAPGTIVESVEENVALACQSHIARTFMSGNVILVGSSAHVEPSSIGLGIPSGIQDAFNLGWKLVTVLSGASIDILESYNEERRATIVELQRFNNHLLESLVEPNFFYKNVVSQFTKFFKLQDSNLYGWANHLFSGFNVPYTSSTIIAGGKLGLRTIQPGSLCCVVTVVSVMEKEEEESPDVSLPIMDFPKSLSYYLKGNRYTLLLCLHVLPPGTKMRTLFGCERKEEAIRWNETCLNKLSQFSLVLHSMMKRETLRICWLICGLVNTTSPRNVISLDHIKSHVPNTIRQHVTKRPEGTVLLVDQENAFYSNFGLKLGDPDGSSGETHSGCFILVRPDGIVSHTGYAGDTDAIGTCLSFGLKFVSM